MIGYPKAGVKRLIIRILSAVYLKREFFPGKDRYALTGPQSNIGKLISVKIVAVIGQTVSFQ